MNGVNRMVVLSLRRRPYSFQVSYLDFVPHKDTAVQSIMQKSFWYIMFILRSVMLHRQVDIYIQYKRPFQSNKQAFLILYAQYHRC